MASKQDLKDIIRYTCGDVVAECVCAKFYIDGIDQDKVDDIICKVAIAQARNIGKVSVCFDKTPKSFDGDLKAYRKARNAFFRSCYTQLLKDFNNEITQILHEMNLLLPGKDAQ